MFDFVADGWHYNGLWTKYLSNGLIATVEYNGYSGYYFYAEWENNKLVRNKIVMAKAFSSEEDLANFLNDKGGNECQSEN